MVVEKSVSEADGMCSPSLLSQNVYCATVRIAREVALPYSDVIYSLRLFAEEYF